MHIGQTWNLWISSIRNG